MPLSDLLCLLRACGHVDDLQLSSVAFPVDLHTVGLQPPPMFVTLPSLTKLSIHKISYDDFVSLAPCLTIPSLRQLSLRGYRNPFVYIGMYQQIRAGFKSYDAMATFGNALLGLTQPMTKLEMLRLSSSLISDRHLLEAFKHLPRLTSLHLHDLLIGTPALRGLTPPASRSCEPSKVQAAAICPQLVSLTVSSCDLIAGAQLVKLIRARNESHATTSIRVLEVEDCAKISDEHVETIRQMYPSDMLVNYKSADSC